MAYRDLLDSHPKLQARFEYSRALLERVRTKIAEYPHCVSEALAIFVAGSLGRHDTGQISDLDIFLIANRRDRDGGERSFSRLDEISVLSDLIQVNAALGLQPFSGDGTYLRIQEVSDLLAGTGTAKDDSENFFTTRLLLLLESKCIANNALYNASIGEIVDMYFRDGKGRRSFRPLFLLNDILRYWRTLCLNYERARHDPGKPWWKRNLNLKFPRKLTVFSSVLAIISGPTTDKSSFIDLVSMTPLERFAYALDTIDDAQFQGAFETFLNDYEEFLAAKSHAELEKDGARKIASFSAKAEHFDNLLHDIFASPKLDGQLVRYVSV